MLIDDDPTQTELTILNLERSHWGFEFVVVQTPKEALRSLNEQSFDCVVSDYMMPDIGAIKLCKNIKSFLNVPFILYTGIESEEVAENAFNAGVDDYIRKEPDLTHYKLLAKKIREAVEKHNIEP